MDNLLVKLRNNVVSHSHVWVIYSACAKCHWAGVLCLVVVTASRKKGQGVRQFYSFWLILGNKRKEVLFMLLRSTHNQKKKRKAAALPHSDRAVSLRDWVHLGSSPAVRCCRDWIFGSIRFFICLYRSTARHRSGVIYTSSESGTIVTPKRVIVIFDNYNKLKSK